LEQFASGTALARLFAEKTKCLLPEDRYIDAEYVFERARSGDQYALEVIDEFSHYLALSIVSISCVLDPELIILGGGVSGGADLFLERLKGLCAPVLQVMPRIEVTQLGLKAGVMGAVALTLHSTSKPSLFI
jgi:glucokinase